MTWNRLVLIFLIIYIIVLGIQLLCYAPRMRAWGAAFHKQEHLINNKKNKIAIIVPARNESKVIGELFESLENQTYDRNYFDVHVIVKEDTDPTIEMAKKLGHEVHIIKEQTCKGDAMEGTLQDILNKTPNKYDQFLLIDADCILDSNYLEEINNAVASGRDVITTKKIVKNYWFGDTKKNSTWACACNGLIWPLMDDLGNKYKSEHNYFQFTVGTGVMFSARVIKEIGGWPYRETLTEDGEFALDAILRGYTCYYAEYARIYVEEATSLSMTDKRRTRWFQGVTDTYRIYGHRLKEFDKEKNDENVHKSIYYGLNVQILYHYFGTLLSLILLSAIGTILFAIFGISTWLLTLIICCSSIFAFYLSAFVSGLLAVIVDRKNINLKWYKKVWIVITYPFFFVPYVGIIAKALFSKKNKGWEVIERNVNFSENTSKLK